MNTFPIRTSPPAAGSWPLRASIVASLLAAACGGGASPSASPKGSLPDAAPSPTSTAPSENDGGSAADATQDGARPSPGQDAGGPDAPVSSDGGAPDRPAPFPAFDPDLPQVQDQGGPVLAHPNLVSVTWTSDPNASYFESFEDGVAQTKYWSGAENSYTVGVGASGASNHVHVTTPAPSSMSDADVVAFITANAGVPGTGWPAPTPNTMYVVYLPPGAQLLFQGVDACQSVGGYHDSFLLNGQFVAYAAVPQCEGGTGTVTLAASHEIGEGSADPFPSLSPAWLGFDNDHLAWDVFQEFQDEIGDACEFYPSSTFTDTEPGFSYTVQRLWSNDSAAGGHNPCVPADTPVYFNTTLLSPEAITVDMHENGGASNFATKGVHILQGQTKTFDLGFYSDAPTNGPWTIVAHDGNPVVPGTSSGTHLDIMVDTSTGQNGDVAHVTVTVTSVGDMNSELLTIESRLGVLPSHWLPILIGSQ